MKIKINESNYRNDFDDNLKPPFNLKNDKDPDYTEGDEGRTFEMSNEEQQRQQFLEATGAEASDEDLERAFCPSAGKQGHYACGWCRTCNKPHFMCKCEHGADGSDL